MPAKICRDHQFQWNAYVALSERPIDFPGKDALYRRAQRKGDTVGTSTPEFSRLASGGAVHLDMATLFCDYFVDHPGKLPPKLSHLGGSTSEELLRKLFEEVPPDAGHLEHPTHTNDPATPKGIFEFAKARALAGDRYLEQQDPLLEQRRFLDPETGPYQYREEVWKKFGYQKSVLRRLTPDQAILRGREIFGGDDTFELGRAKMLQDVNPLFIQWSLDEEGEQIGLSSVFPITDQFFEHVKDGGGSHYDLTKDDIQVIGNTFCLGLVAEKIYPDWKPAMVKQQKLTIYSRVLTQAALLLNIAHRTPIRVMTAAASFVDRVRLEAIGFRKVSSFATPAGTVAHNMIFDPSSASLLSIPVRRAVIDIDHFVWSLRDEFESYATGRDHKNPAKRSF